MEQKLYPSAPYLSGDKGLLDEKSFDVESQINKQLAKVSSFNISIQNIMMMMKFYKLEKQK